MRYINFMAKVNPMLEAMPHRERKYARTKRALLNTALRRMAKGTPLADITVKELCAGAKIATPTFFLYFERKTDLLRYYIQLWSVEVTWHARRASLESPGLGAIEKVFDHTGELTERNPEIMAEIIAMQASEPQICCIAPPTKAELLTALPGLPGVAELAPLGLDVIFGEHLAEALKLDQLPADIDIADTVVALTAIFFGTPLVMRMAHSKAVRRYYLRQLRTLWAALKCGAGGISDGGDDGHG